MPPAGRDQSLKGGTDARRNAYIHRRKRELGGRRASAPDRGADRFAWETTMFDSLIKSGDVQRLTLLGQDGVKLGAVREMFVDLASGRIEFIIVEAGGFLGASGKFHPVPWSVVRYDPVAGSFQANRSKEEFKSSPSYDRDQLADASYAWQEQAVRYFAGG
jgi:hypothetical protein